MKHSDDLTALLPALMAARLDFPAIVRNCSAVARGGRAYDYADLSAIAEATTPALVQHGLMLVQAVEDGEEGDVCITSTLFHTSGQWMACALSMPKPASMQEIGIISTYSRRYQASALLFLSTETDDDAASLNGVHKAEKASPAATVRSSAEPVSTNGHAMAPVIGAHPSAEQIEALFTMALETCGEDPEVLSTRIRQVMNLPANASTSKRLLPKTMNREQYDRLWTYYQTLLAQLQRQTEVVNGKANRTEDPTSGTASPQGAATEPAQPPAEAVPQDPPAGSAAESSSAAPVDVAERERIVREAMDAGIAEGEAWHIVTHHGLQEAEQLLLAAAKKRIKAA